MKVKIYDCTTFFQSNLLFELRFHTLKNIVDHFVVCEATKTHMGQPKKINFDYKKWETKEFIDKLKELNGWEIKTSSLFVSNFEEFVKFYNSIKKYIKLEPIKKINKGVFTDMIIVLTGFRDNELQTEIENQGGKIGGTISKNTNYLVVKDQSMIDDPTEKIKKAIGLNIKIITKDKLIKMLK